MRYLIIVAIVVMVLAAIFTPRLDHADITKWCAARGEEAKLIDSSIIQTGPFFYIPKGCRVYYVKTVTNVYWFRYGRGGEVYQQINGDRDRGDYKQLDYE